MRYDCVQSAARVRRRRLCWLGLGTNVSLVLLNRMRVVGKWTSNLMQRDPVRPNAYTRGVEHLKPFTVKHALRGT